MKLPDFSLFQPLNETRARMKAALRDTLPFAPVTPRLTPEDLENERLPANEVISAAEALPLPPAEPFAEPAAPVTAEPMVAAYEAEVPSPATPLQQMSAALPSDAPAPVIRPKQIIPRKVVPAKRVAPKPKLLKRALLVGYILAIDTAIALAVLFYFFGNEEPALKPAPPAILSAATENPKPPPEAKAPQKNALPSMPPLPPEMRQAATPREAPPTANPAAMRQIANPAAMQQQETPMPTALPASSPQQFLHDITGGGDSHVCKIDTLAHPSAGEEGEAAAYNPGNVAPVQSVPALQPIAPLGSIPPVNSIPPLEAAASLLPAAPPRPAPPARRFRRNPAMPPNAAPPLASIPPLNAAAPAQPAAPEATSSFANDIAPLASIPPLGSIPPLQPHPSLSSPGPARTAASRARQRQQEDINAAACKEM